MPEGQKRAPDLITDGCEPPCGCWELNSELLEEQAMLLTSEPSLQLLNFELLILLFLPAKCGMCIGTTVLGLYFFLIYFIFVTKSQCVTLCKIGWTTVSTF